MGFSIINNRLKAAEGSLPVASVSSPNHGGTIKPTVIVMHYTASWEASGAIRTLSTRGSGVSAHVVLDPKGQVTQLLDLNIRGWHAGPSRYKNLDNLNSHSIGIEIVNPGWLRKTGERTYQDSRGKVHVMQDDGSINGFPGLIAAKHSTVGSGTFYWPAYTEEQLEICMELTKAMLAAYPITDIVSHEEIDTRGWKTDPGPAFPMAQFKKLLIPRGDTPEEPKSTVKHFVVNVNRLNVRASGDLGSKIIGTLLKNTLVTPKATKGDWVQTQTGGWVFGKFLDPVC